MNQPITEIEQAFSSNGILAASIPNYAMRQVQVDMALAIVQALKNQHVLVVEAGTGTGKTYAYLLPSLLSGKKIIVSTGTKNLQDQLFHRDLPLIRKALGIPINVAVLKGRSNYLCLYRLNTYQASEFHHYYLQSQYNEVVQWATTTQDGEIEHFPGNQLDKQLQPFITSNVDNCLGHECEFFTKCHVMKARKKAQEADLLIINHHLFFADSQLKERGITEFLPNFDAVIFDEAHQLHEIATHFLGESLSGRQLAYLARDIIKEQQRDAADMAELKCNAEYLFKASREFKKAFGNAVKGSWENIVHKPQIKAMLQAIEGYLSILKEQLEIAQVRAKGLENCYKRVLLIIIKFQRLVHPTFKEQIHWYEVLEHDFVIHQTPLSVSHYFKNLIDQSDITWIFTSATLSIKGSFEHFNSSMGLSNSIELMLESPFNYQQQALLYMPKIVSQPHEENYILELIDHVVPLLEATEGKAFFLFTSHKALQMASIQLAKRISYPLLVQGELPKSQLLATFCQLSNAVLLGTSSFWEGVDVKGSSLSCVIIDKIPFQSPHDPILKTRLNHYKKMDKDPFIHYQVPHAVIALRQGVGRLIRDPLDRGILMLADPRLHSKAYGEIFLQSLPAMPLTACLNEVQAFLTEQLI